MSHKSILGRLSQYASTEVGNNATKEQGVIFQVILILYVYELDAKIDDKHSYTLSRFSKILSAP